MKHEHIEINPDIMGGKPVIRRTRAPICAGRSLAGDRTRGARRNAVAVR
jgi:uncharacterized protein (DUF433 family)